MIDELAPIYVDPFRRSVENVERASQRCRRGRVDGTHRSQNSSKVIAPVAAPRTSLNTAMASATMLGGRCHDPGSSSKEIVPLPARTKPHQTRCGLRHAVTAMIPDAAKYLDVQPIKSLLNSARASSDSAPLLAEWCAAAAAPTRDQRGRR